VVSESRVTWATSVPILVFLGLSVLDLGPMYAADRRHTSNSRQTDVRQKHCLMPRLLGAGAWQWEWTKVSAHPFSHRFPVV